MCSIVSLSPHSTSSTFFPPLLSLSPFPRQNLTIIFLSRVLFLPRYFAISSVIYLSYSLLHLDSLILSFACPNLCPFHSVPHSSIFLLLLIFLFLHWHTRSSGCTSLCPSPPFLLSPEFHKYSKKSRLVWTFFSLNSIKSIKWI
jgi:hypothetical protein